MAEKTAKSRAIQAITGRVNREEFVQLGDWRFGYLSLRIAEVEELQDAQTEASAEGGSDRAYWTCLREIARRRCIDDPAPSDDDMRWSVGLDELAAYIGWLRGGDKPGEPPSEDNSGK